MILSGSHALHAYVGFKNLDNLYREQPNCPCLRNYELLN